MTIPVTYEITDYSGEVIQIRFTNRSCKKRHKTRFELKKKIKKQGDKSLVKWIGYHNSFNSWIDTKTMVKLTTEKSL